MSRVLALLITPLLATVGWAEEDHGEMDAFMAEAARLLPVESIIAPSATANAQVQVPADKAIYGEWGPVLPWPHIAVTAANLPDGRIVTFSANARTSFPDGAEFTYAAVWDAGTGQHTEINHPSHDMFCGGPALRTNGQLIVSGGHFNSELVSVFDYENDQWLALDEMHDGRWYPTTTVMPNGSVVTASGNQGHGINSVERYADGKGWTILTGAPWNGVTTKAWPFNFVAPDGRIFSAGPQGNMHWVDPTGAGQITATSAVFPGNRLDQSGGTAMIDAGKLLFAGGGVAGASPTTKQAHVVDFNSATPAVTEVAPMIFARRFHNALMLPNGNAIMIGGTSIGIPFQDGGTIYAAEMWNPSTDTWSELADMSVPRNYHSVALMLPDGRVFSAGGGLSGNPDTDHQDAQVYSPPYLFNADGSDAARPQLNNLPAVSGPDRTVQAQGDAGIDRFTMVRMTATTHAFTSDIRFLEIPFAETSAGNYALDLHPNVNVLVPGYWMVFALDTQGTPSLAKMIRIAYPTTPVVTTPGDQLSSLGGAVSVQIVADDEDGDTITFSASGLPQGLQIDASTGLISGTPLISGIAAVTITASDGSKAGSTSFGWTVTAGVNSAPQITNPGNQVTIQGGSVNLTINATDQQSDPLTFSATGLPPGLSIGPSSGVITGTANTLGDFTPTLSVSDGTESDSTSIEWEIREAIAGTPVVPGPVQPGSSENYAIAGTGANLTYTWDFGDGSAAVVTADPDTDHTYSEAGRYTVAVTITDDLNQSEQLLFHQSVHAQLTANRPSVSQSVVYEERAGNDRVWNVNPDNDTISVFDAVTGLKLAELAVGENPRSLAIAPDGRIWVANKKSSSISIVSGSTFGVEATVDLPRGSQPHGLAFDPTGASGYLVLEGSGELAALDVNTGAITGAVGVGANPRHLSINSDGSKLYVSRFVTPPLTGESTLDPAPGASEGGEVVVVTTAGGLQIDNTITLEMSTRPDGQSSSRGVPNYLGPAAISPDGTNAWVASKQDNIGRGSGRDGNPLTHENSVRGISSRLDLSNESEAEGDRVDHDNAGIGSTSLFDLTGNLLFSALEGSRHVAVIDVYNGIEIARFKTGRAPQGLALSPDGRTLYVHNFMGRSVTAHDVSNLVDGTGVEVATLATHVAVGSEKLNNQILLGKRLFYDSQDQRMALEEYVSCASCHNDGGQDGRVWDMTGFGEGLRNTIDLRGRGGAAHGALHWSANFDEIQDFEAQIRALASGTGLLTAGNPHPSLGTANAGRSADLDALAAYVTSLTEFDDSPFRPSDGGLTPQGLEGKLLFVSKSCADCHSGAAFTDSPSGARHDIGTILESSGNRSGGLLDGIDTPTLRSVWNSAPYLHDGRAPDLGSAIGAHPISLTPTEVDRLVDYLRQLDSTEPDPAESDHFEPDDDTVALYHFDEDFRDSSPHSLHLAVTGGVALASDNLGWMGNPGGAVARFSNIGDELTITIPDALIFPNATPWSIDTRLYVRNYLGAGNASVPILTLEQSWDTFLSLDEDIWGGPSVRANAATLATNAQWLASTDLNQWLRLQISYDGVGSTSLYIDGVLVNTVATSPNEENSDAWSLTIGNIDADIDEFLITRGVLNPQQDTTAPGVVISTASTTIDAPFTVNATFSEIVTGLTIGDINAANGTASNLSGGGQNWSFTITPVAAGDVAINLGAGAVQDAAGNPSTASNTLTVTYAPPPVDTTPPGVVLSTASNTVSGAFIVNATFDESVSGLTIGEISVSNGLAGALSGGGTSYSFSVTPGTAGAVTISVPAGVAQDGAGNSNLASNLLNVTYTAPTGGGDELVPDGNTAVLYHFNTGFDDSSGNSLNLSASGSVLLASDNLAWMSNPSGAVARFDAIGDQLSVAIPDSLVLPDNAPLSIDARIFIRAYLGYGVANLPIISLEQGWNTQMKLSEDLWGGPSIDAHAVAVATNQQWLAATQLNQWHRLQISYDGVGTTSLFIDGAFVNAVATAPNEGNGADWILEIGNIDGDIDELQISRSEANAQPPGPDTTAPAVVLSTPSNNVTGAFVTSVSFSESVSGFALGDIVVGNGSASSLSGAGTDFTFIVTPGLDGNVSVSVPAGAVQDAAGNPNDPSNALSVTYSEPVGGGDESGVTPDTIALYHLNGDLLDSSANALHLTTSGNVQFASDNLGWMQSPSGAVARFSALGDTLSIAIPDALVMPVESAPLTIEARVFSRNYLGYSVDDAPVLVLHQDWDAHYKIEDPKWGNNPKGPRIGASGTVLATAQQWANAAPPNQWHNVQISYDGTGTVSCWVNDVLLNSVFTIPNAGRTEDWILTLGNFDGDIDEVHLQAIPAPAGVGGSASQPSTNASAILSSLNGGAALLADDDGDGWSFLEELAYGSAFAGNGAGAGAETAVYPSAIDIDGELHAAISFAVENADGIVTPNGYQSANFDYTPQASIDLENWNEETLVLVENPDGLPASPAGYRYVTFRTLAPGRSCFVRVRVSTR